MAFSSEKKSRGASHLLAACGMNCSLCHAFQRTKDTCPGCRRADGKRKAMCACKMRSCPERGAARFCSNYTQFPCTRLKAFDKRYRTKYAMSPIENLRAIKARGTQTFFEEENTRWACAYCGNRLCVHKELCQTCGHRWR